jgi:hypothetical protein
MFRYQHQPPTRFLEIEIDRIDVRGLFARYIYIQIYLFPPHSTCVILRFIIMS